MLKQIKSIILYYTKESGVRQLERCIDKIFRKLIVSGKNGDKINILDYLGNYKYKYLFNDKSSDIGVINTLGCTNYGGCLLKTTVSSFKGNGNIISTGMLGDAIKESIYVAISYIKSNNYIMDIDNKIFSENDFHVHLEDASFFKDGPSAGVAIVSTIISLIKKKAIDSSISMTGEITLRGKILPVGGIKEKILTALNNNIKTIYIPIDNKDDVKDIPKELIKGIKIKYVNSYLEIYNDLV